MVREARYVPDLPPAEFAAPPTAHLTPSPSNTPLATGHRATAQGHPWHFATHSFYSVVDFGVEHREVQEEIVGVSLPKGGRSSSPSPSTTPRAEVRASAKSVTPSSGWSTRRTTSNSPATTLVPVLAVAVTAPPRGHPSPVDPMVSTAPGPAAAHEAWQRPLAGTRHSVVPARDRVSNPNRSMALVLATVHAWGRPAPKCRGSRTHRARLRRAAGRIED